MEGQSRSRFEDAALVAARSRAVVLVEGLSDQAAVEALAERRGRDLRAEGVSVVPIGGAQAIGQFIDLFGPVGRDVRLAGICDAGRRATSGAASSAPASVHGSPVPTWSGWGSSCARPIWRTS